MAARSPPPSAPTTSAMRGRCSRTGRSWWPGTATDGTRHYVAMVRYNSDGSLDASFGTGGKITAAIGTDDQVYAGGVPDRTGRSWWPGTASSAATSMSRWRATTGRRPSRPATPRPQPPGGGNPGAAATPGGGGGGGGGWRRFRWWRRPQPATGGHGGHRRTGPRRRRRRAARPDGPLPRPGSARHDLRGRVRGYRRGQGHGDRRRTGVAAARRTAPPP